MNLDKHVSTYVGATIILLLAFILVGVILYSWNWAGDYMASMINNIR